jgi:hypothetical protein
MAGNDQIRFCSHCAKSVNNISAMTRRKAEKLVMRSNGNICIRYRVAPDTGAPIFSPKYVKIAGRAGFAAGVLGAAIATAQPTFAQGSPLPIETIRVEQIADADGRPAKVSGIVTDPQGAVVPFAVVVLTNKENGDSRWINADGEGAYEFLDVPAGRYSLKIEAVGFQNYENQEFALSDGSQLRQNARLEIPQVAEVVQVQGDEGYGTVTMGIIVGDIAFVENRNLLVQAVLNDDLGEVKVRVAMRARVNVRDKAYDGMSPLHAAVQNGNLEIARFLLERGAKVNIRDYEKRTPIMMLDEDASPEMVELLMSYGAKPKLLDKEKNGALHHAAINGVEPEIVRSMINFGFNINAVNKLGMTPLMVAA